MALLTMPTGMTPLGGGCKATAAAGGEGQRVEQLQEQRVVRRAVLGPHLLLEPVHGGGALRLMVAPEGNAGSPGPDLARADCTLRERMRSWLCVGVGVGLERLLGLLTSLPDSKLCVNERAPETY